jgi:hypothetical protein
MSSNRSPSMSCDANDFTNTANSKTSNKDTVTESKSKNKSPADLNSTSRDGDGDGVDDDTIKKDRQNEFEYCCSNEKLESNLDSILIKNNSKNNSCNGQFQVCVYIKHIIKFSFNSILI